MKGYSFTGLLQSDGWIEPAFVHIDGQGKIESIHSVAQENVSYDNILGYAIPGVTNGHSHAFQYAMVGITERHNAIQSADDFWSWRNAMYDVALKVTPDQMEAIAAKLYSEMLRHGYTHVTEFHYVHNNLDGRPYDNRSELGERLIAAAKATGIKITLVPILYQQGGFGKEATSKQRRFLTSTVEDYLKLFESSKMSCSHYEGANIGFGPHSMRAVSSDNIKRLVEVAPKDIPFHIHLSERKKEIEESINFLKARPVQWMIENTDINHNYNFVHCTHLTESESKGLAKSQANVVLCPSTEGNLGDGIFSLGIFQNNSGKWCIGTDSQIGLNPFEELRLLDYGQRTKTNMRKTFYSDRQEDSGLYALNKIVHNGRHTAGQFSTDFFDIGSPLDALIIKDNVPIIQTASSKNRLSTIVYSSDSTMHYGTMINGKWVIQNNTHLQLEKIDSNFVRALNQLKTR